MTAPKGNRNTARTIKRNGRKYVVVHATVARKDDQNVSVQLVKRAGKAHWFIVEGTKEQGAAPVRYKDFWAALEAYSVRQDELGVNPTEALPHAELEDIVSLNADEQATLAANLEARVNV